MVVTIVLVAAAAMMLVDMDVVLQLVGPGCGDDAWWLSLCWKILQP